MEGKAYRLRLIMYTLLFVLACAVDLATSLWLYASVHPGQPQAWELSGDVLTAAFHFTTDSVDVILMCLSRCLLLPLIVLIGLRIGSPKALPGSRRYKKPTRAAASVGSGELSESLVMNAEMGGEMEEVVDEEEVLTFNNRARLCTNSFLAFIFMLGTGWQVFAGLKCVGFMYTAETLQGVLMGLAVIWTNCQTWSAKQLLGLLNSESGFSVPNLHKHDIYLHREIGGHYCDLCRRSIRMTYRCHACDFDCCKHCFQRRDRIHGEGLVRSDKGVKQELMVTNSSYMLRALRLILPYIHLFGISMVCLSVNCFSQLALPNYQGSILDHLASYNGDREKEKREFFHDVLVYMGLSVATGFFGAVRDLCLSVLGRKIAFSVRNSLFSGIIVQDKVFFDGMTSGQLTSRLSGDVNAMVSPCQTMLSSLLQNILLLMGGLVMCFWKSWKLSMVAFTTVGPVITITRAYATWSSTLNRRIYAAMGDANSDAQQAMANIQTVKMFSTEEQEKQKYNKWTKEALHHGLVDAFGGSAAFALNNYLDLGASVLILWYGGVLILSGNSGVTPGDLICFQLYWNMMNSSYKALTGVLTSFTRASGAAQRVLSLADNLPDIDINKGDHMGMMRGSVELQGVWFTYQMRPDQAVLKGINLSIEPGKVLAIVGRSGCGKSTIINLLLRFYDPSEGRVLIDGRPLSDWNLKSVHRQMGAVTQSVQLFANTIEENIAYGVDSYTQLQLHEAARQANCHDFIMEFPDQYQSRIGEAGARLSGGQRQRIAIARLLLRQPKLLLLDEATSALDAESEAEVQVALDHLIASGGRTVVLVAHRLSTVMNADKIAVVHKGQVMEEGDHASLCELPGGIYASLVKRQMAKQSNQVEAALDREALQKAAKKETQGPSHVDVIDDLLPDESSPI